MKAFEPETPPTTAPPPRTKFRLSRLLWAGIILLVLGTGPLLTVIALAKLGLTKDPNPNPIGFGILTFLTFWPSVILIIIGAAQSYSRYQSVRRNDVRPGISSRENR